MTVETYVFKDAQAGNTHLAEDRLAVADNRWIVADGITRDPLAITDFTGRRLWPLRS